jgi:hypothetical protein
MAPDDSDISIVFQGPISHKGADLAAALLEARSLLPRAEYILSTWSGQFGLQKLGFDRVVMTKDPGPDYTEPVIGRPCNMTRQVTSTLAGLEVATRKYAIKIRTDFRIKDRAFLKYWSAFEAPMPEFNLFSKPVAIVPLGTRNPVKMPLLFNPSDFFMFGVTSDVIAYWRAARRPRLLLVASREKLLRPIYGPLYGRLAVEQELFLAFLREKLGREIEVPYLDYLNPEMLFMSERYLLNSFCILPERCPGAHAPTRLASNKMTFLGNYSASDQRELAALPRERALRRYDEALSARRDWWFSPYVLYNWASIVAANLGHHAISFLRWLNRQRRRVADGLAYIFHD